MNSAFKASWEEMKKKALVMEQIMENMAENCQELGRISRSLFPDWEGKAADAFRQSLEAETGRLKEALEGSRDRTGQLQRMAENCIRAEKWAEENTWSLPGDGGG